MRSSEATPARGGRGPGNEGGFGVWLGVLVLVASISGCADPASLAGLPVESFGAHLDVRVTELLERYEVPGASVAVIKDGVPVWSGAYGWADVDGGRPMTLSAVDHVGSITKSVTAWGVMVLVERGVIGLDDPVTRHLTNWTFPESGASPDKITIRQLLNHTSGLPLGTIGTHYPPGSDHLPSLRENLSAEAQVHREPGSAFEYSNVGFNLLELLIEEVTGDTFSDYMVRHVLGPLGMDRATFTWSEQLEAAIPLGYDLEQNPVSPYVYPEKGSGGLFAGLDDIARFVAAGLPGPEPPGRHVLAPETVALMYEPGAGIGGIYRLVAPAYGLGYFAETLPGGEPAVWHGGQGHGWMTHFHALPETGAGIVVLTNSQRSWPFIAEILTDWAEWNGAGAVGMTNILRATTALQAVLAIAGTLLLWQSVRIGLGVWSGRRRVWLRPLSWFQIAQLGSALAIGGLLEWAVRQDYLFVASVFPTNTAWLAVTLIWAIAVLVASAVWAVEPESQDSHGERFDRSHWSWIEQLARFRAGRPQ